MANVVDPENVHVRFSQERLAKSKRFGIVSSLASLTKGFVYLDCVIFIISPPLNWNLKILF